MFNFFKKEKQTKEIILKAPIKGEIIDIKEVEDPAFSTKALGDGIAIKPFEGKLVSPANGTIEAIFPTKHAIGIKLNNGIRILIHIGMDTVKLNGEHFIAHIEKGEKVSTGDLLIEFDIEKINEKGYSTTTPIVITNTEDFSRIESIAKGNIELGEDLFKIVM